MIYQYVHVPSYQYVHKWAERSLRKRTVGDSNLRSGQVKD